MAGGAAGRPGSVRGGRGGAGLQRSGSPPQVRLLKGPPPFEDPLAFDGLGLARHLDEDSLPSSDEELLGVGVGVGAALQDALYPLSPARRALLSSTGAAGQGQRGQLRQRRG